MIYLGLGSNLGDRVHNLKQAINLLKNEQVSVEKTSAVYETAPVGVLEQPDFLNLVIAVSTKHSPLQLLDICLMVESKLGRIRTQKWGPRIIDIDILLYHDEVINDERLIIPHPFLQDRRFVLEPLAEIADNTKIKNYSVKQLLEKLHDHSIVRKIDIKEIDITDDAIGQIAQKNCND